MFDIRDAHSSFRSRSVYNTIYQPGPVQVLQLISNEPPYGVALSRDGKRFVADWDRNQLFVLVQAPNENGYGQPLTVDEHREFQNAVLQSNLPYTVKQKFQENFPLGKPVVELLKTLDNERPFAVSATVYGKHLVANLEIKVLFVQHRGSPDRPTQLTPSEQKQFARIISEEVDQETKEKLKQAFPDLNIV